jgi:glucose-1-phosphate adenylyltransferase
MYNALADTFTFVLAGGEGRRLVPLTRHWPKPLIPYGGSFRLIDFTLSNCLNSGLERVCVLTQHQSRSIRSYLRSSWSDVDSKRRFSFPVSPIRGHRYQGTADAVLQNLRLVMSQGSKFVLVLSADHIYKMDYAALVRFHADSGADATIASVECPRELSAELGVLGVDETGRVVEFKEKPSDPKRRSASPDSILANMGVYVFNSATLLRLAGKTGYRDFGANLIPALVQSGDVKAYYHEQITRSGTSYWRDVGTIESYYTSNMDLLSAPPAFDPSGQNWPIRNCRSSRKGALSLFTELHRDPEVRSIIAEGATVAGARLRRSVIFPGVILGAGVDVQDSILLPGTTVGRGATIRRAIIDAAVRISPGDNIGYDAEWDRRRFAVSGTDIIVVSSYAERTVCQSSCSKSKSLGIGASS